MTTAAGARLGLVLGGGGTVGIAYHVGVLRALEQVAGITPDQADLVVGTSAGAVVGAQVRSGWTPTALWELAMGTHPLLEGVDAEELARRTLFTPGWADPVELVRRSIGASFVLARSLTRFPLPEVPGLLGRLYPGGLFTMAEGRRHFELTLPEAWPERDLWLVAVDITTGKRVVLGRPGAPPATLHEGVYASCAIPGVYPPVRLGNRTLVDGGAHSSTNLDLAGKAACDLVIGVAPMAYEPRRTPDPVRRLTRLVWARMLSQEADSVRRRGGKVLLVRPTAWELRVHGVNALRATGTEAVAEAAYTSTARLLETELARDVLGELVG